MPTTTIVLIVLAIAVIAAIAFVALRGRLDPVAVAASDADDDPALSASGEAMIVGDVMPIDSNEPGVPPGTAQPSFQTHTQAPRKPSQLYEAPRRPEHVSRAPEQYSHERDPAQSQSELVADDATQRAGIRWTKRFDPRENAFDDATRLALLRDLGIVRAPWGVPLLTQAYEEEPAAEHRRAALRALAAYRHPDTQPAFELALRAEDEETRAIAANALGALRIRAALPS
ncbi:MAG: HEAT repeat domain-containing protein [Candidatus Eremiobacteraeota bacterium]|nr:HEAT repeat domain-containing protein [Candidatus Eremiobacteraeota bacterium]